MPGRSSCLGELTANRRPDLARGAEKIVPAVEAIRGLLSLPAAEVAPMLLGAMVRSVVDEQVVTIRLTEVEAYGGQEDAASHAYRGLTPRTAVMFGAAGHLYCYFVYGMHWCANIVTGPDGEAGAVLLRAAEVVEGQEVARARRPAGPRLPEHLVASGPGRLARSLGLHRGHVGIDVLDPRSMLRLIVLKPPSRYESGPRVGVSGATAMPWRFWIPDQPSVSAYRLGGRRRPGTTLQT